MPRKRTSHVAVTSLARMAVCEKQALLQYRTGRASSSKTSVSGTREHKRFQAENERIARGVDGRCFIASAVFGANASETWDLRLLRDLLLQPTGPGRLFIRAYYALSPSIARWLSARPLARAMAAKILLAGILASSLLSNIPPTRKK